MSALANAAATMTLQDFLAWEEPYEARWELVEGQPMAMAPTTRTHAAIQAELGRLIANVRTETIGVELLRRGDDGNWPAAAEMIEAGDLAFRSIGVQFPLEAVYR